MSLNFGGRALLKPKKIFAIGDIHGEADKLQSILNQILPILTSDDHIVFCGDLINRGPKNPQVLEIITDLFKNYPNQIFVIQGNHDFMLQNFCVHGNWSWMKTYGGMTLPQMKEHWKLDDFLPQTILQTLKNKGIWEWLEKTIPYYETEEVIITHAPLHFDQLCMFGLLDYEEDFTSSEPENSRALLDRGADLMWEFSKEDDERIDKYIKKFKICGHQFAHHKKPRVFKLRAFIDTGCGCKPNAPLTCLMYPGKKIFQS